jgi:adhesin transport system membrane fusion protein
MTAVAEGKPLDQAEGSGRIIKIVGAVFVIFLAWAALAWVDEIVRAEGEVVSTSRSQIVQNLEGGILAELHVRQGDRVGAGDVLARLQDTKYRSSVDDLSMPK